MNMMSTLFDKEDNTQRRERCSIFLHMLQSDNFKGS